MKRLIFLLLLLFAHTAQAQFLSGNMLHDKCNPNAQSIDRIDCLGYISGVHDALSNITVCSPSNVTRGQVRDVVMGYLQSNPDQRHLPADLLIGRVLFATWPCKPKQPTSSPRPSSAM